MAQACSNVSDAQAAQASDQCGRWHQRAAVRPSPALVVQVAAPCEHCSRVYQRASVAPCRAYYEPDRPLHNNVNQGGVTRQSHAGDCLHRPGQQTERTLAFHQERAVHHPGPCPTVLAASNHSGDKHASKYNTDNQHRPTYILAVLATSPQATQHANLHSWSFDQAYLCATNPTGNSADFLLSATQFLRDEINPNQETTTPDFPHAVVSCQP